MAVEITIQELRFNWPMTVMSMNDIMDLLLKNWAKKVEVRFFKKASRQVAFYNAPGEDYIYPTNTKWIFANWMLFGLLQIKLI